MNPQEMPPEFRIWQISLGFANTGVVHALVKTGIVEQMREQPRTLDDLIRAGGWNPGVLFSILRYASVIGLVNFDGKAYTLTETGRLLLKDVPGSMTLGALLFGSEEWLRTWNHLDDSLLTGSPAFDEAMGEPFFRYLGSHPEMNTIFNQWMTVSTQLAARALTQAYDFTPFRSVCDIGGGEGILLKQILLANPHLSGILYDLESAVKENVLAGLNGRVQIQTGSFFDRVPAADVIMMKSVLHDWSDEKSRIILNHCREALQPASRLLIIDRIIASPTDLMGAFFDVHMQLMSGGRERTESEFNELLQGVGLKLRRIIPTQSFWKIIEASL